MKGIFLDLETNGLDCDQHSVLEVAVVIVDMHTMTCIDEYSALVKCSEKQFTIGSDPEALKVNGITLKDVLNAKTAMSIHNDLTDLFLIHDLDKGNSIFICQNPSFDRSFFTQIMPLETQVDLELPYHWLDLSSMFWIKYVASCHPIASTDQLMIGMDKPVPLSKDAIARRLGLPPEEKPHRAMNGVKHLISCYSALVGVKFKEK